MARGGLEHKLQFLCAARNHGDFLCGFAKFFVPCLDRIIARRKVLQLEIARLVRHRKEGMLEDGDITAHPGMNIALHGDGYLFAGKGGIHTGTRGLGLVPFAIVGRDGMDVMCRSVIVHYVELLIRTQSDHVRGVYAAFLLHADGLLRGIKRAVTQSFGDKHDDVLQTSVSSSYDLLRGQPAWVQLGATRVCVHVYARRGGPRALEFGDSFYYCGSGSRTVGSSRTATGRFTSCHE